MSIDELLEYRVTKLEEAVADIREAVTDGGWSRRREYLTVAAAVVAALASLAHYLHP